MRYRYQSAGRVYEVALDRMERGYRVTINGESFEAEVLDAQPGALSLRFDGRPVTLYWATQDDRKWVSLQGCTYLLEKPDTRAARAGGGGPGDNELRAPMPAQVLEVYTLEGGVVEKGQTLMLLEAMKMEIRIQAPLTGTVLRLAAQEGETVERNQVLLELSPEE